MARQDAGAEEIDARLAASLEIRVLDDRDTAFVAVAMDAAASGHPAKCRQALAFMHSLDRRDAAAADCARLALRHASVTSATEIAETIRSLPLRDAIYGEIARNPR